MLEKLDAVFEHIRLQCMNKREIVNLFKISFTDWLTDDAPIRAAALTFFIILPLPSLLLIVITFFSLFYGQTQATQQITQLITSLAGPSVAGLFRDLLAGATSPFTSTWTAITVVAFSLGGAIGAFSVLRDTMDCIWEAKLEVKQKLITRISQKIGPFFLVSSFGFIVIAWTVISTPLFSAIEHYSTNGILTVIVVTAGQILVSFNLSTLLFALIYKVIPEVKIHWEDVILPAIVTSIAFTITNYFLGLYVQTFTVTTIIGAAGSLMIILLWIFILNLIVLFGAEFSKVYASTFGPHPLHHSPLVIERIVENLLSSKEEQEVKEVVAQSQVKLVEKTQDKENVEETKEKISG